MRPLRVLALPVPMAVSELSGASGFNSLRSLVKYCDRAGHNWFWYVVIPERYRDERLDFPSRVKVVFVTNECLDYYTEIAHSHSEVVRLFNQQYGQYPVDAVLTERVVAGAIWQRLLSRQAVRSPLPVTVWEPAVNDTLTISQETELALRALTAVSCKYIVLNEEQVRLALHEYGRYLSGSMLKRFREQCRVLPQGCDVEVLDRALTDEKFEKFTVMYGGRIAAIKRVDLVVRIMEAFYSAGRDVRNLITTQTVGSPMIAEIQSKGPSVEIMTGVGRDDFHKMAARSHVFLCASREESEGIGLWEGLYLAGVGLFPDRPWVRALMPPGFPYLFSDVAHAVAQLKSFYENYAAARVWTAKVRSHIREKLNSRIQAEKHLAVIAEGVDNWKGPTEKSALYNAVKGISEGFERRGTPVSWQEFAGAVKQAIKVHPFQRRVQNAMPGVYDYYRMFLGLGWQDTCEQEWPVFIRSQEVVQ